MCVLKTEYLMPPLERLQSFPLKQGIPFLLTRLRKINICVRYLQKIQRAYSLQIITLKIGFNHPFISYLCKFPHHSSDNIVGMGFLGQGDEVISYQTVNLQYCL